MGLSDLFSSILKPQNVVADPAVLQEFSRDHSFVVGCSPQLLVYPATKLDVQAIVKLAAENRLSLVPVSSGTPRFHGDTLPNQSGVMVDFTCMKRILKIDPINRAVMVEPGVTYGELIPEVTQKGLKLDIPLLPRANKSVVTSRLEREPVSMPKYQYDHCDPLLTLEVIYGNGEEMRTGSASGPGNLDTLKSDKVNPWGPGPVDYARFLTGAQGTMGLVTWAITKAEVLPSLRQLYFVQAEDPAKLTLLMNHLLRKRVVDECLVLNNVNLATILAENFSADYAELKAKLPTWTLITCLAGYRLRPEERIVIMQKYLFEICADLNLKPETSLRGAAGKEGEVLKLISGVWDKQPYWKLRAKGSTRDLFFLTTLGNAPDLIALTRQVIAKYSYPAADVGCYVQPLVQGRSCHCEFNFPCDPSNAGELAELQKLIREASHTLMQQGAFFSRPYGEWAQMVYSRDSEGVIVTRKLKNIFDPQNIFNPGKLCF